jgi:hypothetical protein
MTTVLTLKSESRSPSTTDLVLEVSSPSLVTVPTHTDTHRPLKYRHTQTQISLKTPTYMIYTHTPTKKNTMKVKVTSL